MTSLDVAACLRSVLLEWISVTNQITSHNGMGDVLHLPTTPFAIYISIYECLVSAHDKASVVQIELTFFCTFRW